MAEERTKREAESRTAEERPSDSWLPASILPNPDPEDHPELEVMSDIDSRFEGNIEIGGLLLCKAPEAKVKQRDEYYEQVAASQMESVDNNFLKQNDPRMPVLQPERSTRTTFGRS